MIKRGILFAVVMLAMVGTGECWAYQQGTPEFRAMCVNAWSSGFKTSTQVDTLLSQVRAAHLNAVVVQMRRRGDTFFTSTYEPWASGSNNFDALAYLIQKAHNLSPRIEVHCWFVTFPIASAAALPTNPNHPYNKYPQYLMKDDAGNTSTGDDYWFDPGNPDAFQYTYNVFMDVISRYDIDGINFDYIRYPGNHWGYNDASVARFNAAYGRTGQPVYNDALWCQWRRDQVTNLVRKVYANAIAIKPNIKVSADTITWSPPALNLGDFVNRRPYTQVFQDWRSWMEEGILDLSMPMNYYQCQGQDEYWQDFYTWACFARQAQYNRATAVNVDICSSPADCIADHIDYVRNASCSGAAPAFGWGGYAYSCGDIAALASASPTAVPVPAMPWKTSPTKGHIKGTVTFGGSLPLDGATVTLTGPTPRTIKADGTGFFAFIDLAPGPYTLSTNVSPYGCKTVNATVTAGPVTTANIDLNGGSIAISNVQAGSETESSVVITWTTNIPSSSQVAYGIDRNCTSSTTENTSLVTSHSVTVSGLQPRTAYFYRVISRVPPTSIKISPLYAFVTKPSSPDVIIDNPAATFTGTWTTSTNAGDYGADYKYVMAATSPASATYTPNITVAGDYKVSVFYPALASRSTVAPHTITYNGGSQLYTVNQNINGSQWWLLATKPFAVGTAGNLQITNSAPGGAFVNADAVRFQFVPETTAPSIPQGLQGTVVGHDRIDLAWTASTDNVAVDGYRVSRRVAGVGSYSVVGATFTNSYSDTDAAANTRYDYTVSAFDTSGNKSGESSSIMRRTMALPPTSATISCDKQPGVWHTANPFTFSNSAGFGPGGVSYYTYAWDTSTTYTWVGGEWTWASMTAALEATAGPDPWYFHVRAWGDDGLPNGTMDLGPYYFDNTAPGTPIVADGGVDTESPVQLFASWEVSDPDSGIAEMQYAVGTTSGGAEVVGWTATSNVSQMIAIPEQQAGTVLYVSVKARNAAGIWGAVGTSDGVTVGSALASVGGAKAYVDGSAVRLSDRVVTAVFSDCVYIADDDRLGGIRVDVASSPLAAGARVNVGGKLSTVDGQRVLTNAYVVAVP